MWPHETTSGRGRDVGALRVTACACLRTLRADFTYFTFRGEIHCEMKCEMDQSFHCEITFPGSKSEVLEGKKKNLVVSGGNKVFCEHDNTCERLFGTIWGRPQVI